MSHFLSTDLPCDLPENWTTEQYVAPQGSSVGLSEQHGYNYLCHQVNEAQRAALTLAKVACSGYENILDNWYFEDPVDTQKGYCVFKGIKYYRDSALTSSAGTLVEATAAQRVDATYGTIVVQGTTYYVSAADIYRGYVGKSPGAYTFDRWHARACCAALHKSGKGIIVASSNDYVGGTFRQPIVDCARLAGKTVLYTVLVDSFTGNAYMSLCTATSLDTSLNTDIRKIKLKAGLNTIWETLPNDIGKDTAPYLFADITTEAKANVCVRAVKLQVGSAQTLVYDTNDNGSWEFVELPNKAAEMVKCAYAPIELGGHPSVLSSTIEPATIE